MMGISKSSVYRIFFHHVSVPERFYLLCPVISVDEFRATTDKGTYAFHITDPVSGETIDIIEDRKASSLKNYFTKCPLKEKNRVRIIIMDLSNPFRSIMHNLFPHATIIADRFHYVRVFGDGLRRSMIDTCSTMKNKKLAISIKRNPHLFDKYQKDLNDSAEWYDRHLKKYFTCRSYIEYVFEQEETDSFYESYQMLKLIHEKHNDCKKELNRWLDHIFETKNQYYLSFAKNIRKNWFIPILKSLSKKATYTRNGRTYTTSCNNGFIESMNNKVKPVKRNANGYRYFNNLRKRILLHLGFAYEFR